MNINSKYKSFLISVAATVVMFSGCGGSDSSIDSVTITSNNSKTIMENSSVDLFQVTTDAKSDVAFRLAGTDKDAFTIDTEGNLKFLEIPNFEQKSSYTISVEVLESDTVVASQAIAITITDDISDNNDVTSPVFNTNLPDTIDIQENRMDIMSVLATDDASSVAYAVDSGDDKSLFTIDSTTGALKFSFVPDYEHASDANKDNVYQVVVSATDSASNKAIKAFTVNVTNDSSDDNAGAAVVLKTGLNDGQNNTMLGYGDDRGTATGLNWEDDIHVDVDLTWEQAVGYCAGKGMRVPTRKELFTLVNYANIPTIDNSYTNKNTGIFWTNGNLLRGANEVDTKAWAIDFRFGGDYVYDKNSSTGMHVRCVSGAATFSNGSSFTDQGDTILDNVTGLIWEHNETATLQTLTWSEAMDRCKAKGQDWRLPNINELHTIMPENEMNSLLVNILGDVENSIKYTWSSTEVSGNTKQALYMGNFEFNDGTHYGDTQNNEQELKDLNGSIRSTCVRGGHL